MRTFLTFLCACAPMLLSAAQIELDTLKVGSQTYREVKVLGANMTDVYFKHAEGFANAKIRMLDRDLQKRLNFNPEAAAAAEKQQALDDAKFQAELSSNAVTKALGTSPASADNEAGNLFPEPISERSLIGKRAPDLSGMPWEPASAPMKDRYLLVTFWKPSSAASAQALSAMKSLEKQFSDQVTLLSVVPGVADIHADDKEPLTVPTLQDRDSKLAQALEVTSVPTVVLIDPLRTVLYSGHPAGVDASKLTKLFAR